MMRSCLFDLPGTYSRPWATVFPWKSTQSSSKLAEIITKIMGDGITLFE